MRLSLQSDTTLLFGMISIINVEITDTVIQWNQNSGDIIK